MFAARNSIFTGQQSPVGQQLLTASSGTWTCPANVFSVCVVQVGMGGQGPTEYTNSITGGCGGGSLTYRNAMPVVPGTGYGFTINTTGSTIFGITAGAGATSVNASGASPKASSGPYTALFAGGNGGNGNGTYPGITGGGGGGGAGGYSAAGANGGSTSNNGSTASGGGGGGGGGANAFATPGIPGGTGGGVGLLGAGSNGSGGTTGSPGNNGTAGSSGSGTTYGGGGGGADNVGSPAKPGGPGGIRIIWGTGRAFPSTRTADE